MAATRSEKRLRKKKKPPQRFRLSYSLLLLLTMVVVGLVSGVVAYRFGKQSLEGVNPSPAGIKLPKASPAAKPKDSPKPTNQKQNDGKTSFWLDEAEVIAEMKARSQQELGELKRPVAIAKANISDRKKIYTRVDRAYNSMRDPLAISADADERIAARIAALRQRVYISSRAYDQNSDKAVANQASDRLPLLSTPVDLPPIRSRWEDRDASLVNSRKVNNTDSTDIQVSPKATSDFFIPDQQPSAVEVNRR